MLRGRLGTYRYPRIPGEPRRFAVALWGAFLAVLACGPVGALDPGKRITQYLIDDWSTKEGLPHNSVLSITQTDEGYLWFGTYEGLVRFDGVTFSLFSKANTPEMKNNGIMALYTDKAGNLWVGTPNGLLRYRDGKFSLFTEKNGLTSQFILSIFEDRQGYLWIGTTRGMNRFSGVQFQQFGEREGFYSGHVSSFCETTDGVLWIGTNGGGLYRMDRGKFRVFTSRDGLPSDSVHGLALDMSDRLWVGTPQGLGILEDGGRFNPVSAPGLPSSFIRTVYRDRYGVMWIGTDDGGLSCWKNGEFSFVDSHRGLADDSIRAILEDREGSLWIGTYNNGINRLKDSRFSVYGSRNGLPIDLVRSVFTDGGGGVWIGTMGGGVVHMENEVFRTYGKAEGLPNNRIVSIAEAPDGTFWFGTYGGGLAHFAKGTFTCYSRKNGLSNDIVRCILVEPDGTVWAGTNGGGINIIRNGKISVLNEKTGLSDDFIYTMVRDHLGDLWVGAYNGTLMHFHKGRITTYGEKQGLAHNAIWAIYPDPQGTLWLGTNEGGLKRFHKGRFQTFSWKDGLMSDQIFQVLEDSRGQIWMNSNRGIFFVSKRDLIDYAEGRLIKLQCTTYETADGTVALTCGGPAQPAGHRGLDGRLWFPTLHGVVVIDPENTRTNPIPPPVRIESLMARGTVYPVTTPLTLDPGTEKIDIHFTALSFLVPQNVRFKYKLDGFDHDWSEEVSTRSAAYTNLPPGEYVFRVIACNNDGLWNPQAATLELTIRPFFHQTGWFVLLCTAGITLLAIFAHRFRLVRLRRRQKELEAMVERRTTDLIHLNRELVEVNQMKGELLNIAAHDLKNPLQAILGYSELIREKIPQDPVSQRYINMIYQASKSMVSLINDLLVTSKIESGKLILNVTRQDVSELARICVERQEEQAHRKRQRITFETGPDNYAECDAERTREIIDNLLSNAVKYSPKGAGILVEVSMDETTGKLRVAVKDEGPGLSEEDLKRLFGKFQRLSAQPTGGEPSTGLGLSISKCLAEMQNGQILVESVPGHGATFILELPRGASAQALPSDKPDRTPGGDLLPPGDDSAETLPIA